MILFVVYIKQCFLIFMLRPAKIKKLFLNHQNFKTDARARAFFFVDIFTEMYIVYTWRSALKTETRTNTLQVMIGKIDNFQLLKKGQSNFFYTASFFFTYYSKTDARAIEKQVSFFFFTYIHSFKKQCVLTYVNIGFLTPQGGGSNILTNKKNIK